MGVESVSGIWDLNILWPLSSDDRTTSDDHHRLIKDSLLKTFPNVDATISALTSEINNLSGLTVNAQTKLTELSATINAVATSLSAMTTTITNLSDTVSALDSQVSALTTVENNTYRANIGAAGTTGGIWPSGWILTSPSTGIYQLYHGLNSINWVFLVSRQNPAVQIARVTSFSADGLTITVTGVEGTADSALVYLTAYNEP